MINVTKTFLPPINEYQSILERAWNKHWITNRGELVKELEVELQKILNVHHLTLTCNGTIPIQIAIKALELSGEIITTPFSYVASTSSISWENCKPVFVDIDSEHLTIDEHKIESVISKNTSAILATHVFGNPCNVEVIQKIADKYKLKVIYDAAHAFGVTYKDNSIFKFGDVSTCSFHATKIFHTGEGGAMISGNKSLHDKLFYHHNFGHNGPEAFHGIGINGKMSELSAALGLAILPYLPSIIAQRKRQVENYIEQLSNSNLDFLKVRENTNWNYSYFPVIFKSEELLLSAVKKLNDKNIIPRRYFYPSLTTLGYTQKQQAPIAESISKRILCLPLYHDLSDDNITEIGNIVKNNC